MATVFDISLLQNFQIIFGWLFVFILVYAALELTKVLGENKGMHAILAVCAATLFSFSPKAVGIVTGSAPWFVIMLVVFMFLLIGVRFAFGQKGDEMLLSVFGGEAGAAWWIFVPVIIIVAVMLATTTGPELTPGNGEDVEVVGSEIGSTATPDWQKNIVNTVFHPKVLGMIVILLIAMFAILTLTSMPTRI